MIINNLFSNAIKYADPEKERKWISVNFKMHENDGWELSVEDNGLGIGQEHLDEIFDMFYRANETSDGSGLGLYITKETINKLNGAITVNSEIGKGTTMRLAFEQRLEGKTIMPFG